MTAAEPDLGSPITTPARTSPRERVKASQDMAAALAHELRGPVYGITSAAQLLRYRITDDPVVEKNIGRILREAERLNSLVRDTARIRPPRAGSAGAGESGRCLGPACWPITAERSRRRHSSPGTRPPSPCIVCDVDPDQLGHAFSNALANAIDAAPEGTDLAILSSSIDGIWESCLRNDGSPVAPETLAHAFEPLVSTKAGHPGIGLAIAHRVVCDHGGAISLESAQGIGTTLTFKLPASHG